MKRTFRYILQFVTVFLGVLIILAALAVWRLSTQPISSSFLTPYIEKSIDRYIPGTRTTITSSMLTWNNIELSVALNAVGIKVVDEKGAIIAEVPKLDVQLNVFGLAVGQFLPEVLVVDSPQIKLEHNSNGEIKFGHMTSQSNEGASETKGDLKDTVADIANNLAHAFITHKLIISNAEFDVHDSSTQKSWKVHIPEISLERINDIMSGKAKVELTQKDKVSTVDVLYTYDPQKDMHVIETELNDITPSLFAGGHPSTVGLGMASIFDLPLTGKLIIAFDTDLNVQAGGMDMQGGVGRINHPDFWDIPRDVKSLKFKAQYGEPKGHLDITVAEADFGQATFSLTGAGTPPIFPDRDLDFVLNVKIENWAMDEYTRLWPKPIIPNARSWIADNLSKGQFTKGDAVFKGHLKWNDLANIVISEANGKLAAVQGQVQYLEGMPRVQNVNADATFDLQKMSVLVSSGHIGDLRLVPFTLLMTDLDTNLQMIEIPLKVEGPITDVLKLIDEPPLGYAKAVGLSPSDVTGRARATLNLKFPLLKTLLVKDIEIKGQADLIDLASSKLLKGIDITQGNLSLDLNKESFAIKGPASLNKVPFKILWEQNFSTDQGKPLRHAEVEGMIAGDQWNLLGIEALNGTRGSVAAFIELTQPNKEKTFLTGKFDMTSAEVHVDQLSWKKPSAVPATFKFAAEMEEGRDTKITSLDLIGGDAKIKGDALLSADNQLRALNLNPLMIGRTNAVIKFWQEKDEPHTAHYEIEGQSVDVSGIKSGGDAVAGNSSGKVAPAAQPPKRYKIKLAKLFTSETGYIADLQGHAARDDKGWNEIQLQGMAQGAHKLNVDLAQRSGSRFLAITCDNFGKALHGLGFTDAVNDGKLDIRGQSSPDNPYAIQGRMKIGRFDVTNLPILALLLNATSPFGIVGLLTDTISFESARGRFKWDGDVLEFIDARVSGQSLGLNIEGKVNTETNTANLSGTVVPFSMVNRFLSAIPLIGDMLTGGDGGGVLAVAYTIKGDLSQPDVSVNPVSLLTPGFLRNLFFGGIDEEEEPAQELPKEENPPPPVITNFNKKP